MKTKLITFILFILTLNLSGQSEKKISYIDNVDTLEELLSLFKGRIIYVDFWASWCSPCLKELEHDFDLDAFFEKNNIVKVYIGVEKYTNSESERELSINRWKKLVNKKNLIGYNYYTQNRSDFMTSVYGSFMGKLSLPRFIIVDSTGKIVQKNAKKPSEKDKLIKQLNKYLI